MLIARKIKKNIQYICDFKQYNNIVTEIVIVEKQLHKPLKDIFRDGSNELILKWAEIKKKSMIHKRQAETKYQKIEIKN